MKVTYTPNPLRSIVELDGNDRYRLKQGIENDLLYSLTVRAQLYLREGKIDRAIEILDAIEKVEEATEREATEDVSALRGSHCGDCICVPCTCTKCQAERHLDINTLDGLNKHMAYKIAAAFGENGDRTIEQALESLANYDPTPWPKNRELWDSCMPRWKEEATAAHAWLLRYRNQLDKP